jgi:hypothetical protein
MRRKAIQEAAEAHDVGSIARVASAAPAASFMSALRTFSGSRRCSENVTVHQAVSG